ncbi:hypothetical protein E2C01_030815 [Portunus trituberculatus]|uniref:Uncharacterized protein n=1 Tax=Portunus trituberculatus TaxID=210409 RepID=A0A5B7ES10_PORTR|nr:hypothetical protein [Portunus trituberculatus]
MTDAVLLLVPSTILSFNNILVSHAIDILYQVHVHKIAVGGDSLTRIHGQRNRSLDLDVMMRWSFKRCVGFDIFFDYFCYYFFVFLVCRGVERSVEDDYVFLLSGCVVLVVIAVPTVDDPLSLLFDVLLS